MLNASGDANITCYNRMTAPDFDYAVMDRLRFKGTCFDEHWDVLQRIWGNETNPIAFF